MLVLRKIATTVGGDPALVLADVKTFIAVEHNEHDALITTILAGVQAQAEAYSGRSYSERTLAATYDLPASRKGISKPFGSPHVAHTLPDLIDAEFYVDLLQGPVQSITSVVATSTDATTSTLDSAGYYLTGDRLVFTESLPSGTRRYGGVQITYVTGAAIGAAAKVGLMRLVQDVYDHPEDFVVGRTVAPLPMTAFAFLDVERSYVF